MEKNLETKLQQMFKKKIEQMQIIPSETCPTSLMILSHQNAIWKHGPNTKPL